MFHFSAAANGKRAIPSRPDGPRKKIIASTGFAPKLPSAALPGPYFLPFADSYKAASYIADDSGSLSTPSAGDSTYFSSPSSIDDLGPFLTLPGGLQPTTSSLRNLVADGGAALWSQGPYTGPGSPSDYQPGGFRHDDRHSRDFESLVDYFPCLPALQCDDPQCDDGVPCPATSCCTQPGCTNDKCFNDECIAAEAAVELCFDEACPAAASPCEISLLCFDEHCAETPCQAPHEFIQPIRPQATSSESRFSAPHTRVSGLSSTQHAHASHYLAGCTDDHLRCNHSGHFHDCVCPEHLSKFHALHHQHFSPYQYLADRGAPNKIAETTKIPPEVVDINDRPIRRWSTSSKVSVAGLPAVCGWISGRPGSLPCGQTFSDGEELHRHLEEVHIDTLDREDKVKKGFYCHWEGCDRYMDKSFPARPKLKRHTQIHTDYKPFACNVCGAEMKTKDAMEKHKRTHTGEKPYECTWEGCTRRFATSTELKTHTTVHSGDKPHVCKTCGEAFADSSNLSKHKKVHYNAQYRCFGTDSVPCGKVMKRWDQLKRHLEKVGHMTHLLGDDEEATKSVALYKAQMAQVYQKVPEESKRKGRRRKHDSVALSQAGTTSDVETESEGESDDENRIGANDFKLSDTLQRAKAL